VVTAAAGTRPGLGVRDVRVTFGDVVAVDSVSLQVEPGEIVAGGGPSGCG
jgi:ABC-type Fe3+/spermidine/putrescine transport system ATPase subunit